jgi:hypothetical protein
MINYENHYALIENYVEKYIPLRQHQAIIQALQMCKDE